MSKVDERGAAPSPATAAVLDLIAAEKLFAILRGIPPEHIVPVTQALFRGGVRLLEVAIDHSDHAGVDAVVTSLGLVRETFAGEICYGAGTVLTTEQVRAVSQAGARFVVSPNVDPAVIAETVAAGMVSLPGAMTPTEIVAARNAGAQAVKLFPAGALGVDYVKALGGPLKGIPLIAVGGINERNIESFLAAGAVAAGLGDSLVGAADIAPDIAPDIALGRGDFAEVEARARAVVGKIRRAG